MTACCGRAEQFFADELAKAAVRFPLFFVEELVGGRLLGEKLPGASVITEQLRRFEEGQARLNYQQQTLFDLIFVACIWIADARERDGGRTT